MGHVWVGEEYGGMSWVREYVFACMNLSVVLVLC